MKSSLQNEEHFNLVQIYLDRVSRYGQRTALLYKNKASGVYEPITWNSWADQVKMTAMGLYALGVRRGDRIGILSENRPEWTIADLAVLSLGAVFVPIYPTSSPQDVSYILENAGAGFVFISTGEQFDRLRPVLENPALRRVVIFDSFEPKMDKAISLEALYEKGRLEDLNNSQLYNDQVQSVVPDDLATLIYTSGTTGPPKGVMLTHCNFVSNYLGASRFIKIYETDTALSFLPLCHVFERLAGYYFMVFHGATIAYAENMQTVAEDMRIVRPTIAAAVPRFYEKVHARLQEKIQAGSPVQQKIFHWALEVGKRYAQNRLQKKPQPFSLRFQYALARSLVFRKIKAGIGGRLRFFISGGAPLSKELAEFFYAADILILEGYGLTETSPVIGVNCPEAFRFGTVGRVIPNVQVKIAEDGEILTKGPCVMKGYYKNQAATDEVMQDGWFHTGDIGVLSEDGFLKITDRKKDIIATSGGKKVSPQNIEGLLMGEKLFSQVVVLGDKRNYLVALIYPNRSEIEAYAKEKGIGTLPWEQLLFHPLIVGWADGRLRERINHLASYEQIKYFTFLSRELTQESGELTPTLKVKRKIVMEKYKDLIDAMYSKANEAKVAGRNV